MGGGETWEILGIDQSLRAVEMAEKKEIPTINAYFNLALAKQIKEKKGKADLIIANFVMANIPDIEEIGKSIELLLNDEGIFVFETGYICDILRFNLIDTIYFEHLNYFSLTSLQTFLNKFNLRIFKAKLTIAKGGALRVYVCKKDSKIKVDNSVEIILDDEKKLFSNPNLFSEFSNRINKFKEEVQNLSKEVKLENPLCIYGASIGCIVMIEYFDLGDMVDFLIDDNLLKIDKFSPSRAILVKSSKFLLENNIKKVINFAWRFILPISEKNREFLDNGGIIYNINLKELKIDRIEK